METPAVNVPEHSPTPSTQSRKPHKVLSRVNLRRKDHESTQSLSKKFSHDRKGSVDSVASAPPRPSTGTQGLDGVYDQEDDAAGSKLSKLIPGHKKRQRRRILEQQLAAQAEGEELFRGRSAKPVDAGLRGAHLGIESSESVNDDDESLLTNDSDVESPLGSPPPLVSHPSHAGYLTSSSPQIRATTSRPDTSPSRDEKRRSLTLPAPTRAPPAPSNLAPRSSATFAAKNNDSALSVGNLDDLSSSSRSVSPGSRIKDVFRSKSKKEGKDMTPSGSPERTTFDQKNGGPALLANGERNSMSARRASSSLDNPPDTPSAIQTNLPAKAGKSSLSSISTFPQTPPGSALDTPSMNVTPPTPVEQRTRANVPDSPKRNIPIIKTPNPNVVTSQSGNMISHRRARSDSTHQPSKLSNSMSAPLTPMPEEGKTPGPTPAGSRSSSGTNPGAGGFFSSVFSGALNAANQFSNSLANNQGRPRSNTAATDEDTGSIIHNSSAIVEDVSSQAPAAQKKLAIDTMGNGDLSLSHLGIADPSPADDQPARNGVSFQEEASARQEDNAAARAISAAYLDQSSDMVSTPIAEDALNAKPSSFYESSIAGEKTTPNGSIHEEETTTTRNWRSGSVRSRMRNAKRNRNNSAATQKSVGAIGAAIGASHATFSSTLNGSVPRLTGFAVASKKRNRDFHQLFRSVPEDDYLIEDYSCALQREIILAGRIYVAEGHICFSSNILGWVTTLVISFDEIVSVEKENTAVVFPNAIAIQTLQARHTFRSLLSREATYDLIIGIWKIHHPSLNHTQNGTRLNDGGTGDKTEKADASPGSDEDDSGSAEDGSDVYDEDDEDDEAGSGVETNDAASLHGSENPPEPVAPPSATKMDPNVARKASALGLAAGKASAMPTASEPKAAEAAAGAAESATKDYPGPATHAPTDCVDAASHYDRKLIDETLPAPLGKVFSMCFGAASGGFMSRWLLDEVKVWDLQLPSEGVVAKSGLSAEAPTKTYSYMKPLPGSIGPRQTKCIVTDTVDHWDLERSVTVTSSTQTPDVPSGNAFLTKTRFCFSWGERGGTRLYICYTTEWSGKSWLKGPIEKGSLEGQTTYATDLLKALRAGLSSSPSRARSGTQTSKPKRGTKTPRSKKSSSNLLEKSAQSGAGRGQPPPQTSILAPVWEILDAVGGILGGLLGPVASKEGVIGALVLLLVFVWFRGQRGGGSVTIGRGVGRSGGDVMTGMSVKERVAAYETLWAEEEEGLWGWLEERVGLQGGDEGGARMKGGMDKGRGGGGRVSVGRGGREELPMARREIEWAIERTEERLRGLREGLGIGRDNGEAGREGRGERAEL